jgi:hypothetical protein
MTSARHAGRLAALAAVAMLAVSCGQSKTPKVDAATERAEALERAKKGPLGTQVNALETAKSIGADANQKAGDQVDRIEKDVK